MTQMNGKKPKPGPSRRITEEEVCLACAAFLITHEGCGQDVKLAKLADTVVCYCDLCNDTRIFWVTVRTDPLYKVYLQRNRTAVPQSCPCRALCIAYTSSTRTGGGVLPRVHALSQTEIGKRLGLPQRKVSRIIASSVKSLKETLGGQ